MESISTSVHHSHANLVVNVRIKKMDLHAFVCLDMKEKFAIKVICFVIVKNRGRLHKTLNHNFNYYFVVK